MISYLGEQKKMVIMKYETPKLTELNKSEKKLVQDIRKKLNILYDNCNKNPGPPTAKPCPYC